MVLVDTSVWVLAEKHVDVRDYVKIAELATSPPVVMEVLRGVRDQRYLITREMLRGVRILDAPVPAERFEQAAELYRRCRSAGVTARSAIDCLIAMTAIVHGVPVLHDDVDFEHIARVYPRLQTLRVSRSGGA